MLEPRSSLVRLPLVGRSDDIARLRRLFARARAREGGVVLLTGEGGVGKSRLAQTMADEAARDGWTVASGRSYLVEAAVPYALFSDALVPLLRDLGPEALTVLTRGARADLEALFPLLRAGDAPPPVGSDEGDGNIQLYWTFTQCLRALAERSPLLLALDDLHWADAASLELLHFLARHLSDAPILIVATVNSSERAGRPAVVGLERSLESLGIAVAHPLLPLTREDTDELVRQAFGAGEAVTREFTALLYGWTRGNPFFIEESLKALVDAGRLHWEGSQWLGWEVEALELPRSIRDAVLLRLARLSPPAREVADVVAVIGARAHYATLLSVGSMGEAALVDAVEELTRGDLLAESAGDTGPLYEYRHPMVRKIVMGEMGLARKRLLHGQIAVALERAYGARAVEHAEELALHFAGGAVEGGQGKAVRYLAAAGRSALARFANREAAHHLSAALERLTESGSEDVAAGDEAPPERFDLMEDLGRARQRLGEFEEAIALWRAARDDAARRDDPLGVASMERRIGLCQFWAGRYEEALRTLEAAADGATTDLHLLGRIRMARGVCLHFLGRGEEARLELRAALSAAERAEHPGLLPRVHRALLLFHAWAGEPDAGWSHGLRAVELAQAGGEAPLACACHWALAVVAGLTGRADACREHLEEGTRLADELRSPLLRLAFDEVAVEYASLTGAWDDGIAMGEKAIALARGLNQRTALPRLLVWTALIYLGRHELDRAAALLEEAWTLSGADAPERARDVHSVIPAHTGMAAYHVARGDLEEAVRVAEQGLALADRTGHTVWAVHRLLAVLAEASLRRRDLDAARRWGARLRRDAERLHHPLGLAWADACDGLVVWLDGDIEGGALRMREGAEALEAAGCVPDAARLRRQLAGRLAELDDGEGALRELEDVADIFVRLRAKEEERLTRKMYAELDKRWRRPRPRPGPANLTGREMDVVRLIGKGMSNARIGRELHIATRTVSTHLTNIYRKLGLTSRYQLARQAPDLLARDRWDGSIPPS